MLTRRLVSRVAQGTLEILRLLSPPELQQVLLFFSFGMVFLAPWRSYQIMVADCARLEHAAQPCRS